MNHALRLLAVAVVATSSADSRAAESYDSCTGYIDTIPATIAAQGTWCLRHDVASTLSSGNLIAVNANNVVIDCNGYKVGGLGAGPTTNATGIAAAARANVTVRGCNVRGFANGIVMSGAGLVAEDNRLDGMRFVGISFAADGSAIRGNTIVDTGSATTGSAAGITVSGSTDVLDNVIENVDGDFVTGIQSDSAAQGTIGGNRMRGITRANAGSGYAYGILLSAGSRWLIRANQVMYGAPGSASSAASR